MTCHSPPTTQYYALSFYRSKTEIFYWNYIGVLKIQSPLKVSKSQNKFMKSSFLPKNERNIARISALNVRAEILAIFRSFFGRNDDNINLF